MTLDLPAALVLIGVGGYSSFRTYVFYSNSQYNAYNGEKLVLKCLHLGCISAIPFLFLLKILDDHFKINAAGELTSKPHYFAIIISVYLIANCILGAILAGLQEWFNEERNKSFIDSFRVSPTPKYSNELEKHLLSLLIPSDRKAKEDLWKAAYIELKSKKIYIGLVLSLDLDDDMPISERFVTLCPLKSGRRNFSGDVVLDKNYLDQVLEDVMTDIILELDLTKNTDIKEKDIWIKATEKIQPITFSQPDIASVRKFDEDLAKKFKLI